MVPPISTLERNSMIIKRSLAMLCAICFAIICAKSPTNKDKERKQKLVLQKIAVLEKQHLKESDPKKKEELKKRSEDLAKRINS